MRRVQAPLAVRARRPGCQAATRFSRLSIVHLHSWLRSVATAGTLRPATSEPHTYITARIPTATTTFKPTHLLISLQYTSQARQGFLRLCTHLPSRLSHQQHPATGQDTTRQGTQRQTRKRYAPNTTSCQPAPAQRHPATTATKPHTSIPPSLSNLAGSKRRSLSSHGGLLFNKMFGGSSGSSPKAESNPNTTASSNPKTDNKSPSPPPESPGGAAENGSGGASPIPTKNAEQVTTGEKRSGNGSPPSTSATPKRRSSGVSGKASSLIASAKNTLNFAQGSGRSGSDAGSTAQTPIQKLGKEDPSLVVPQGQHNNAAGESLPGPKSTFRVGVWEDRNKKCRRTMEDTHAFLYNFLHTPAPALASETGSAKSQASDETNSQARSEGMIETDNGYFAIFDGHAGTFAADWCGKKLHIILEDVIKKNPNVPVPELLDQTFTTVDTQLEKLPLKNSGCTAAVAVMRWEDRVPSNSSQTGSQSIAPALAKAAEKPSEGADAKPEAKQNPEAEHAKLKGIASRQRVLYTANVGDARIILCRSGKALRLSYDHKGSDENEGKRISNAGGLILNSRVNGVLAVTRALGDSYMKDLVTGHPYTTETVIQPDIDEFIIIACDGVSPTHLSCSLKSADSASSSGMSALTRKPVILSETSKTRQQLRSCWWTTP